MVKTMGSTPLYNMYICPFSVCVLLVSSVNKKGVHISVLLFVIPLGFEPKTHSLEGCCSNPTELRNQPYLLKSVANLAFLSEIHKTWHIFLVHIRICKGLKSRPTNTKLLDICLYFYLI